MTVTQILFLDESSCSPAWHIVTYKYQWWIGWSAIDFYFHYRKSPHHGGNTNESGVKFLQFEQKISTTIIKSPVYSV